MSTYVLRAGRIYVDDELPDKRWSFSVYSGGEAFDYLLNVCPTTRDAMAKLAAMRRAVRAVRSQPATRKESGER